MGKPVRMTRERERKKNPTGSKESTDWRQTVQRRRLREGEQDDEVDDADNEDGDVIQTRVTRRRRMPGQSFWLV